MTTANRMPSLPAIAALALILLTPAASAYSVYPFDAGGETQYLKWGSNQAGTAGGVVTWSFLPAGTPGAPAYCGDACPGVSVTSINIENFPGGGFTLTPLTDLEDEIRAALDKWAAAADISFVKLPSDSGVAVNDPAAVPDATGHIRIGVFAFAAGGGAVGYAPPPNGGTAAGDVIFDANSFYQFAPGDEGDSYDTFFAPNDIETLLLHELGHALGLAHPPFDGNCPVMQVGGVCFGVINRELDADDIDGIRFLYGAAPDADGDGIADSMDNCTLSANPDQRDSNGDGFGNVCDADLDNNGVINVIDLGLLKLSFFSADADPDFNGDGAVNAIDLGIMKAAFFGAPGPSGLIP